jgi:hypothetical protein
MEVSGIEGNFRHMCESVMRALRGNKDSVRIGLGLGQRPAPRRYGSALPRARKRRAR